MQYTRQARPSRTPDKPATSSHAGWLITSITILGVCGGGAAYFDIQSKRGELYDEQSSLKASQASLAKTRSELESRQHAIDEIQDKGRRVESLEEQKKVLNSEIATMEGDKAAARTDMANAVKEARTKAAGTTLSELRLADGQVLNSVRFVSVSNSEISVSHDGGMVRLPAKSLPRDLQDRFRFGTVPSDSPPPAKAPMPAEASAPPAAVAGPAPLSSFEKAQRLQTLNTSLVALRARLASMEAQQRNNSGKEQRKNSRDAKRGSNSTSQSSPPQSTRQMERADKKKAAGDSAKSDFEKARVEEMNNLRLRIFQVEAEMYNITNGKP